MEDRELEDREHQPDDAFQSVEPSVATRRHPRTDRRTAGRTQQRRPEDQQRRGASRQLDSRLKREAGGGERVFEFEFEFLLLMDVQCHTFTGVNELYSQMCTINININK